jgi:hypothetical protein
MRLINDKTYKGKNDEVFYQRFSGAPGQQD